MTKKRKRRSMPVTNHIELTSLKCWAIAEAKLREGVSPRMVAEYIHSQGEMTDLKTESLRRRLYRYKNRIMLPKETVSTTYIDEMVRQMDLNLDDVDALTKVILVQQKRVAKDLELEERMPKLAPWLSKEIQMLFDMIERRAKLMQTLGILPQAPNRTQISFMGDQTWSKLIETLDPDQRAKARAVVQAEYAVQMNQEESDEEERRGVALARGGHDDDED